MVGGLRDGVAGGAGADLSEVPWPFQPLPAEHQPSEQELSYQRTHEGRLRTASRQNFVLGRLRKDRSVCCK